MFRRDMHGTLIIGEEQAAGIAHHLRVAAERYDEDAKTVRAGVAAVASDAANRAVPAPELCESIGAYQERTGTTLTEATNAVNAAAVVFRLVEHFVLQAAETRELAARFDGEDVV